MNNTEYNEEIRDSNWTDSTLPERIEKWRLEVEKFSSEKVEKVNILEEEIKKWFGDELDSLLLELRSLGLFNFLELKIDNYQCNLQFPKQIVKHHFVQKIKSCSVISSGNFWVVAQVKILNENFIDTRTKEEWDSGGELPTYRNPSDTDSELESNDCFNSYLEVLQCEFSEHNYDRASS